MDIGQGSSWIPATPGNPGTAKLPPSICSDRQENQQAQVDWSDLQRKQALEHAAGATAEAQNAAAYCGSTSSVTVDSEMYGGGINMYNNFPSDNVDMWSNVSFGDLLAMAHAGGSTPADETVYSSLKSSFNPLINSQNADESSIFSSFPFNLNSPPRTMNATLSSNIPFQFAPVTPDPIKSNEQASNASKLDINVTTAGRVVQSNEDIIKRAEANELQQNKEQSELILDQSELQEYHNPGKEGKQDTELNNTPDQKPRRRKHRPKVVVEGKPKRTPKARTEKQPGLEETKTEKRKYVRKNKVGEPAATSAEEVNNTICHEGKPPSSEKTPTAKRKYVRRNQVNKSTEKPPEEGSSGTIGRPAATSAEEVNNTICHEGKPPSSEKTPTAKRKYVRRNQVNKSTEKTPEEGSSGTIGRPAATSAEEVNNTICHEGKLLSSEETSTVKRNVRRNQVNKLTEKPSEEGSSGTTDPTEVSLSRKSTRRSLNFNFESQEASDENSSYRPSTLDLHASNSGSTAQYAQLGQGKEATIEKTEVGITYNITCSLNQKVRNYLSQPGMQYPGPPTPDKVGRNHDKVTVGNQNESTRDNSRIICSDIIHDKRASILQMTPQSPNCSNCSSSACLSHGKGLKRQHSCRTDEAQFYSINARGAYFNSMQSYQAILPANKPDVYSNVGMHFPAIYKKKRAENGHSSISSYIKLFTGETNYVPSSQCNIIGSLSNNSATNIGTNGMWNSNVMPAFVEAESLRRRRSNGATQVQDFASLHEIHKQFPASTSKEATIYAFGERYRTSHLSSACMGAPIADTRAAMKKKRQSKTSILVSSAASDMYTNQHFTKKARGSLKALTWRGMSPIDEIAERLQHLDLNRESSQNQHGIISYDTKFQRENALVLYQRDGSIVPFGGSLVRKRKPRPKVDVDDETDRVWKLLLQDINSEGIDGTDEDKAKWWEEERRVFNSRADSFIARMRLVQGDRRFSPWKGSVVDSVVGVYLTQNVSDHLSSSAFMSLAAHFPLKTDRTEKHEGNTGIIIEEPEEFATDPNVSIRWYEDQPDQSTRCQDSSGVYNTDSNEQKAAVNGSESSENSTQCIKSAECSVILQSDSSIEGSDLYHESTVTDFRDQKELSDLPSSPSSVVSSENSAVIQASEGTDSSNFCSSTSFLKLLQMAGTSGARGTRCSEHLQEGENFPFLGKELSAPKQCGLSAESAHSALYTTNPQNKLDIETVNNAEVNVELQFQTEDSNCNVQQVPEAPTFSETIVDFTERASIVFDSCKSEQRVLELNLENDSSHACSKVDKVNDNPSKAKNGRLGKEKQNIDWDSLRLQAQANSKKRERTANTMDSLDYEAVRCAEVNEIAHTIRERGMNNKLAERIKAFLNRIVSEHGSIDLEWLRDVPPDKAKEYLLSIRGLGLKSVECVRLLTLHHLAFPVDVNVGRIAVRLGWVPLQPLPESLQLHLLELYPILESIQQYLWPRLCKLDQKTLYELHYHMITFGKVFCTKSKPNCNACPLRGECRHFASAFASARLSLPAPEEKSIVQATEDKAANNNPRENFTHLPLPLPPGNQQPVERQKLINSAPIIEVPATPEPIVEVPATPEQEQIQAPEIDIEDFEDHSEIPMIELNMAEFTQNVKKYVENNMELHQVEMSNALVALTSEAASIPTPKLKNVSRLRTEHQVYELPDSHPLLEGMDKREPDDPSSYLLAIWTPGETANSMQPPETQCNSQESGKLCEDETCSSCNSIREAHSQTVRGTLLIPCRTAMRGSFPLNGTYFQVNEVFADHDSSLKPINVPRDWLWNLPRRTVYFGTSIPTIFKGLNTESIQHCFWRGLVCVRGFDQKTRAPRPLLARFHFPASKLNKTNGKTNEDKGVAS